MIQRMIPAAMFTACVLNTAFAGEAAPAVDADAALAMLKEGNARFVQGESTFRNLDQDRRCDTTDNGQHPYVSILTCSDSRVPPELLFDAGIGELFTIRVAGNVADTDEIGTLEYGAGHLHTPLILVMGHTRCGAVTAVAQNAEVHGSIPKLVDNIVPAVEVTRAKYPGVADSKFVQQAIKENVRQSIADILRNSEEIRELVADGKVSIVGAVYDIHNGTIEWLGELPNQSALVGEAAESQIDDLIHDDEKNVKPDTHVAANADSHDDARADAHEASPSVKSSSHEDHAAKPHAREAETVQASHGVAPDVDSHGARRPAGKAETTNADVAPTSKSKEMTSPKEKHSGDPHAKHDAQDLGSHDEHAEATDPHGDSERVHGKSHEANDEGHAKVEKELSLVQRHGLLVPAAFLAAGSMLSGTIVFMLKGKGEKTASKQADTKTADAKHDEPAKPAH